MKSFFVIWSALMFMGLIGMLLGYTSATLIERKDAIEHGAAQHNPETGKFEWIEHGN